MPRSKNEGFYGSARKFLKQLGVRTGIIVGTRVLSIEEARAIIGSGLNYSANSLHVRSGILKVIN
ncbi:MAG: hypothetical protein DRJ36_00045 [Thermoprotei archaeon]|nr:MAG: hypothetical protein DRJ36_00045 [Thermoprotei archaeon]